MTPRHQPCFCEENIWWLSGDPRLHEREAWVAFVSNPARCVELWCQRAGTGDEGRVFWDYHVILIERAADATWEVWDLDSELGAPVPALTYLERSFPAAARSEPKLLPVFRLVAAHEYRAEFHSDRSHMVAQGRWRAAPPPWPPILGASPELLALAGPDLAERDPSGMHNLERYVDTITPGPGELFDLAGLRRRLAR